MKSAASGAAGGKSKATSGVSCRSTATLDRHSSEDVHTFSCGSFPSNKENSLSDVCLHFGTTPYPQLGDELLFPPTRTCLIVSSSTPLSSDIKVVTWSDLRLMKGFVRTGTLHQCMCQRTGSTRCSSGEQWLSGRYVHHVKFIAGY